jgi:hypothetical protein
MKRASVALVLALSTAAYAQTVAPTVPQKPTKPMIDAAERYFRDGVRFTEEGNYDAARVSFEAGYKLSGEPFFYMTSRGLPRDKGSLATLSASQSGI